MVRRVGFGTEETDRRLGGLVRRGADSVPRTGTSGVRPAAPATQPAARPVKAMARPMPAATPAARPRRGFGVFLALLILAGALTAVFAFLEEEGPALEDLPGLVTRAVEGLTGPGGPFADPPPAPLADPPPPVPAIPGTGKPQSGGGRGT